MLPVTLQDLRAAADRIAAATVRTPLLPLTLAGEGALGRAGEVYLKAENLQRTGSFKLRGAYNFLASLADEVRARGVVTHSSGNHAQGVACAAALLGVRATIVIPENAPRVKVERTRAWGAEIIRCENSSAAREETAQALAHAHGYSLVPPFDHPWIVAGQGTVGLEIAAALPDVANVLVPLGGGGLLAGVSLAISELCPAAQLLGVEPELAADGRASLASGRLQTWSAAATSRTLADGVRTQRLGELTFNILRERVAGVVTVSEAAIGAATRALALEARLVAEPTGALSLAAYRRLLAGAVDGLELRPGPTVLVLSGGNVDPRLLAELLNAGDTAGLEG
ncbi:MAG: threonine/serine dehydratase [Deinococcota bacterium]|jgi:threonine dehydratase|nr:threonine/serine dehydratase [Deinococcota bacterium]